MATLPRVTRPQDGRLRILICNKQGVPIQDITAVAYNVKYVEVLNKPTQFQFTVDSSDPRVGTLASDGSPFLDYIRRIIKVYRRELQYDGSYKYILRFAGFVWPLDDNGSEDGQETNVTAIDPLHVMGFRFARSSAGVIAKVEYTAATSVATMLQDLISRTNSFAGPSGLLPPVTGVHVFGAMPTAKVRWTYKMMSDVVNEITSGVDVWAQPDDTLGTNYVARLNVFEQRGQDRPNVVFAWNTQPHTLSGISRTLDPADVATTIVGLGGNNLVTTASNSTAATNYMTLEALQSFSDTTDATQLQLLTAAELFKRQPPQESISITPGLDMVPFRDFNVGDTARETAGPALRGGVPMRVTRIYGMTITWNEEEDESYELVTSKDLG
jgi:hypothetical protein